MNVVLISMDTWVDEDEDVFGGRHERACSSWIKDYYV